MNLQNTLVAPRYVRVWLMIGLIMVFFQIVIGGITRLTGSGLSITKWEVLEGTLPPMNASQWEESFALYKETPQYEKINEGMSLGQFKFIYFWEYFHRLWARSMGFVFAIPFFIFLARKQISKRLLRQLLLIIVLAAIVASFGWIMVASGLIERPWVSAYKLTVHLSLALVLYGVLLWIIMETWQGFPQVFHNNFVKKLSFALLIVTCIQLMLGGLMSGMKAGLLYPTFPDMNGSFIPPVLLESKQWTIENFKNYDRNSFMPALVQILHRSCAYVLIIMGLYLHIKTRKLKMPKALNIGIKALGMILVMQFTLGILTLMSCKGGIPIGLGSLHQIGGILLLSACVYVNYQMICSKKRTNVENFVEN